jgi:hypothetical protein
MEDIILSKIKEICERKRQDNRYPVSADLRELIKEFKSTPEKELKSTLKRMVMDKKIMWYRSINSTFFYYETEQN